MFSEAFVCPRGGGSLPRQGLCLGGVCPRVLCVSETPKQTPLYGIERMVRILLECILVSYGNEFLSIEKISQPHISAIRA